MKSSGAQNSSRSRKRCYHCRTFIDKGEERVFFDRPFCSFRCLYRALRAQVIPALRFRSPSVQSKKRSSAPFLFLLQILLLLLIAFLGVSVYRLSDKINNLDFTIPARSLTAEPDTLLSLSEFPQATVLSNTVRLVGNAADSLIISLSINDKVRQVTLPEKGEFIFEEVRLVPGDNSLTLRAISPSGKVLLLETLNARLGTPRLDWLSRDINRGPRDQRTIALTFDGGSGNGAAEAILDILREKEVQCTLFLTGAFMRRYPDLVKRMVKDGHEIGNHTWSHPHLTTFSLNHRHDTLPDLNRTLLHQELQKTNDYFTNLTRKKMVPYWRAPYGEHNREIRRWAAELGLRQIGWTFGKGESLDTLDWVADTTAGHYYSAKEILQNLLTFGQDQPDKANGGIVLMHLDTQRNDDHAYTILPALIDSLRQRDYELVTISSLLSKR
ncbi:polysaccharide deacetylase family protein [candidate division KSB1 bacterium]|nr:polysaccharide deacetylase family protein [candidate division KSB1 bacterium]